MKKYDGKWLDLFNVSKYADNERPGCKGKILLETPHIDYFCTPEQWREFKEKVNQI